MKIILVFSDTHLSHKFNPKKFELLKRIVSNSDEVIINGDFWDCYLTTFDKFVTSKWKELFPLLKSKKAIYIYGNHDEKWYSDERVNLFSDKQRYQIVREISGHKFLITHGHTISLPFHMKFGRHYRKIIPASFEYNLYRLHELYRKFLIMLFGFNSRKIGMMTIRADRTRRRFALTNLKDNEVLVCGHTHVARDELENRYINYGYFNLGIAQYMLIHHDSYKLYEERY